MTKSSDDTCPVCGSPELAEIKCKVVCRNCGTIVKSCADLNTAVASC